MFLEEKMLEPVIAQLFQTLDISITSDGKEGENSPDRDCQPPIPGTEESKNHPNESNHSLRVRGGLQKRAAGFQATLICLTSGANGEQCENITALSLNSSYGLWVYKFFPFTLTHIHNFHGWDNTYFVFMFSFFVCL